MTPQFQLPTDNLYKFVCLLFFCVFVSSFIVPSYIEMKIELELIEIEAKLDGLEGKVSNSNVQVEIMNKVLENKLELISARVNKLQRDVEINLTKLEAQESVTKADTNAARVKILEVSEVSAHGLEELVEQLHNNNKILDRMYKISDFAAEIEMNVKIQKLLISKLELIKAYTLWIKLITGLISLAFFGLWWNWQIKMDNHLRSNDI